MKGQKFSAMGIDKSIQVAVYDDAGGSHAARFWWMLDGLDMTCRSDRRRMVPVGQGRTSCKLRVFVPEAKEFIDYPGSAGRYG
ncbi:MAG: hypothetical protein Ct9H300mP28_37930 [Pseudomonadota bacterium]|nr:MAG: hypothetical protein Ct9H300mP28_37930 [Pseudomonadota bacterium]